MCGRAIAFQASRQGITIDYGTPKAWVTAAKELDKELRADAVVGDSLVWNPPGTDAALLYVFGKRRLKGQNTVLAYLFMAQLARDAQ